MSRILVCKDNEDLKLSKNKAFQYKDIDLSALKCGCSFEIQDMGDKLVGVEVPMDESEEPIYTVVTKEFGMYAMSSGVKAKVKISFCDDGMMIIDVLEGAILIKPENEILLASRGVSDLPNVKTDGINWINAEDLLSYKNYWGDMKEKYFQDFEFTLVIKGEVRNKFSSFGCLLVSEEVIDISGGAIAVIEAQLQLKEEAKQVRKGFSEIVSQASGSSYEFDDDDNDEDDESDNAYEDDADDGSNY